MKTKILKPQKARIKGEVIYDWNKFQNNAVYEDFIVTRSDGADTNFKDRSCTTQDLIVEFEDTSITLTATDTTVDVANSITAHLTKTSDNSNISGATIVFMIDDEDYTATTDNNGIATLNTWTSSVTRTSVQVEAGYAGNYQGLLHSCIASTTFNVTSGGS